MGLIKLLATAVTMAIAEKTLKIDLERRPGTDKYKHAQVPASEPLKGVTPFNCKFSLLKQMKT
jgi:hypothetical protein